MKIENPFLRKILTGLWYSLATTLVLAALLLTAARVLLPYVDSYRQEIEAVASERTGQPVRIGEMKAEWRGFTPYLVFSDIDLLDEKSEKVILHFSAASVGIHPWRSLYEQQAIVSNLTVRGLDLHITRQQDGNIEIVGLSDNIGGRDPASESAAIARWLFSQPEIGLAESRLAWTDKLRDHDTLIFNNVFLRLRNDEDRHQFDGEIDLPEDYGQTLGFALDIHGDVLRPRDWVGNLYLKGVGLQTRDLAGVLTLEEVSLLSSSVDVEAWTAWDKSKLLGLQAKIAVDDIDLSLGKEQSTLQKFDLDLNWLREEHGWKLDAGNINITTDKTWPTSSFVVSKQQETRDYDIRLSYLRLEDIFPVVISSGLAGRLAGQFQTMAFQGELRGLHVRSTGQGDLSLAGKLQGVGYQPWQAIPGLQNLDGEISGNAEAGTLTLASDQLLLDAPGIFRDKLNFTEFKLNSSWLRDDKGVHLDIKQYHLSNNDINSEGRMRIDLDGSKDGPFIDLVGSIKGKNAGNTSKYLPAHVMNKDAVSWLDDAIKAGSVPGGAVVLKGPAQKFPFHNKEGRFEVSFNVIDGILDYQPGWPMIHDIEADVEFNGPSMRITSNKGRILDTQLGNVEVTIPDVEVDIPVLSFKGESTGSTADALRYVLETKIAGKRQSGLQKLAVTGNTNIKLAMDIPLDESIENRTKGSFTFMDSSVSLRASKHSLDKINGEVIFKDSDFSSRNIKASLFGKPLDIDVDSHIEGGTDLPGAAVRIKARGDMDLNALLREKVDEQIPGFIEGEDRWQITLRIPEDPDDNVHWSVNSRLLNSVVALPAPLIKPKNESRFLKLSGTLPDEGKMQLRLHYGNVMNGIVFVDTDRHFLPVSGELHFGEIPATIPAKPGIVVRGSVTELSVDAWQNWLETRIDTTQSAEEVFPVRDVDLVFASIQYGQHALNNVHINGSKAESDWLLDIESDKVTGRLTIPHVKGQRPIQLALSKLNLPKAPETSPKGLSDPRKLPAVDMKVDEFSYDGKDYGSLELVLVPQINGSYIEKLKLASPLLSLDASGDWQVDEQLKQLTRLSVKLATDDLGDFLREFEYAEGIQGGLTTADAQLQWDGGPADFDVNALVGDMGLHIRKGQLLNVEPGAGRVFGLLSLAALPRRLTLDFSDLFSKGFSFDAIKGGFSFDVGDAYTSDLYLDGPAARIDVSGRIGLQNEDYDQLVTVTPKLTASLPVAGAIVGGPVAGGVLFAVEKLFGSSIDKISRYQYTMTGSWEDPVITQLQNEKAQAAAPAEENPQ